MSSDTTPCTNPVPGTHASDATGVFASSVLMAPMAGVTDAPFRERLRRNGCTALTTEMVSAAALVRGHRNTLKMIHPCDMDPALTLQLFGAKPDEMEEAARIAAGVGWQRLDLNMGCPVKKVVKTGAGVALMRDPALAARVAAAARRGFAGTLTVKIRKGWSEAETNYVEIAGALETEGVDGITLHGRTRVQGYSGVADWDAVDTLCRAVNLPVCGNGDISSGKEAVTRLENHGVAAVMIGRAAMGEPWIFADAHSLMAGEAAAGRPGPEFIAQDLLRQMEEMTRQFSEKKATSDIKKFIAWAIRGDPGSAQLRNRIMRLDNAEELIAEIHSLGVQG